METSPASADLPSKELLTVAQLIVSGLGFVFSLLAAAFLFLFGFMGLFSETLQPDSALPMFGLAWVALLAAVLAAPSLLYSIRRLRSPRLPGGFPELPRVRGFRLSNIFILLWPLVLVLGQMLSTQTTIAWLVLPPLQLLAVGLPIWWLLEIASRRLSIGSYQRGWGVFNFSLFLTTPVVIIVELVIIGFLLVAAVIWIATQPDLLYEIERLGRQIITLQPDPEMILEMIRPYLQNPLVVFAGLAVVAGLVPLIEELLKPLAIWFLAGRNLTPAQGFVAGAFCGGSFALLESLFSLSNPAQDGWAVLAAGRAGTALLHITTTALVGWAMAYAWQKGDYLRLGAAYLLAVGLHSLWNSINVITIIGVLFDEIPETLRFLDGISQFSSYILVSLVLFLFIMLWFANRLLLRSEKYTEKQPDSDLVQTS
jgi:hypothetical protein